MENSRRRECELRGKKQRKKETMVAKRCQSPLIKLRRNIMAVCIKCGTPLTDGFNFCGKCGTPVQHEPVVSSVLTKLKNTTTTTAVYDGNIVDSEKIEKITDEDGDVYEGYFVDGKLTGNATYTFPDNDDTQEDTAETEENMSDIDDIDADDYDIVVNKEGEIMIVVYLREGEPSSPQAFRTADKSIVLKRSADNLIMFGSLPEETFEYFKKVDKILVNEIDDEGNTVHLYTAPLSDQ
jgi:hypothetical protein